MLFKESLNDSNRKPIQIWAVKDIEIYNRSIKSWLEKADIEMYSTHNDGKFASAKRFIRTLKSKIYKCMTLISKHVYILDGIVNKYNNAYHRAIKMKLLYVK